MKNCVNREIQFFIERMFEMLYQFELKEDSVIRKFRITAPDGKSYNTNHYSLEMIIAVGFKVNSERAVQFRKWVNQIAKDYTIKGWVIDDERLKNGGSVLTTEYFDRLLEQIREIHLSKRLDLFLMADDREVLQNTGKITAEIAKTKAETEFEKYRVIQDRLFMSDFDKYMLELEKNSKK